MREPRLGLRFLGAMMVVTLSASVWGQSRVTFTNTCYAVGTSPQEQLVERSGQTMVVSTYACHTEGGPLDGGTMTGTTLWHYSGTKGEALTGSGITRNAGMHLVFQQTQGNIELKSNAGAVTGFEGVTRGRYLLATGAAASLQGKTYTSKFTSIGPGRFRIDTTVE